MKTNAAFQIRRLQRGTENLEPGPLPPEKRLIGPKEAAGLYDPGTMSPAQKEYNQALQEHEDLMTELRKTVYGTIGVNINGQEMEVPLWNKNMTPSQAEDAARDRLEMGLHPFTPEDQLQKAQDDEQARPIGFSRGTDTVLARLTPHEAVLNRNAAELIGRRQIAAANAKGNKLADRGIDLPSYSYGTSSVDALLPQKRSSQSDLLKDAEDTFYGGQGGARPTPTPKPTPKPTSLAMLGQPSGLGTSSSAASRFRRGGGIINVPPDDPVSGSQYIGRGGTQLGPQYDQLGGVNPLPKGAVGVQGNQGFNRSLNGTQPQQSALPTPSRPMTPTEMMGDIAKQNLTATGSMLGTPSTTNAPLPSGVQPYISPEEAAQKGLQWTGGTSGWQPYLSPEQMTAQNLQYTGGPSSGSVNAPSQQTTHFLPPGFTTAVGSTGASNSTPNDIHFLPPGFTAVQGTVGENKQLQFTPPDKQKDQGYGSAYGY